MHRALGLRAMHAVGPSEYEREMPRELAVTSAPLALCPPRSRPPRLAGERTLEGRDA